MADYDVTYSMNSKSEAEVGWDYVGPQGNNVQSENTAGYWCWTNTGSSSSGTGPPSGVPCVYTETSSPVAIGNEFFMTLTDPVSAAMYELFITFDRCTYGNVSAHLYFEVWDGSQWVLIDDWPGDSVTTFTSEGPYDLSAYTNPDFKIRFRTVVGGTAYQNDMAVDEVRIYGNYRASYEIAGVTKSKNGNILGSCEVTLFKADTASPPNYTQIAKTVSDAATGAYSFTVYDQDARYMVYSIKDDTPHVFDATDNVLQGV
jgi:hypothetical protein